MLHTKLINITTHDFLKFVSYRLSLNDLENFATQTIQHNLINRPMDTSMFLYFDGKYHKKHNLATHKIKKRSMIICEWALDKGYLCYGGVNIYTYSYPHNNGSNITIIHRYNLTDKGTDLCCLLFL